MQINEYLSRECHNVYFIACAILVFRTESWPGNRVTIDNGNDDDTAVAADIALSDDDENSRERENDVCTTNVDTQQIATCDRKYFLKSCAH